MEPAGWGHFLQHGVRSLSLQFDPASGIQDADEKGGRGDSQGGKPKVSPLGQQWRRRESNPRKISIVPLLTEARPIGNKPRGGWAASTNAAREAATRWANADPAGDGDADARADMR
jgi:hypothetical protein